jgi:glycine betaine transporter
LILCFGLYDAENLALGLQTINASVLSLFSSYYLWVGFGIAIIAIILIFLPFAKQRLGTQRAEYSYFSWIALLYSTGMGSGLLLRAVQEPSYYLFNPPVKAVDNVQLSLQYTFFHWGLTPWCFYSLFGLIIAYNYYIGGAKSFRSALNFSDKDGYFQKIVGLFIVLITIVGVVASLGLGAGQFIGGVSSYFGIAIGKDILWLTIFGVGLVATLSALTGIHKVIKYLADFDIVISILLMLFVFTQLQISQLISNSLPALKNYLVHFAEMSLSIGDFQLSAEFLSNWTVFYWAFWLAWVPFTGIFIARISKGRTIREFLVATIIVPTVATMVWFSVFGTKAFDIIQSKSISENPFNSIFTSLFDFFEYLPFSEVTILLSSILILTAIINSVDSAIFVVSIFSDKGIENPSKIHKVIWGIIITATALGLASVGTDSLLNAVSSLLIIMALPFSLIYILYVILFIKNKVLKKENKC